MDFVTEGRKLVTIRQIDTVSAIPNADAVEVVGIDGWKVVVKKGTFSPGDYCVFFEVDSFLPANDPRFAFLAKSGVKKDEAGVERIRLRSIKIRGQLSQGLVLPISDFINDFEHIDEYNGYHPDSFSTDVFCKNLAESRHGIEQFLDVTKYERPSERNGGTGTAAAKTGGSFPFVIPKTDEDRIQNNFSRLKRSLQGKHVKFARSLKLDGSSITIAYFNNPEFFLDKLDDQVYGYDTEAGELKVLEELPYPYNYDDSQLIVCSRNNVLKYDMKSHFWKGVHNAKIMESLKSYCETYDRQLAIQCELMGPGIQGNREGFTEYNIFAFRIWDINEQKFVPFNDFIEICEKLQINTVPQLEVVEFFEKYDSIDDALDSADHESINHKIAEGDVYVSVDLVDGETIHFKVINNKFLLKCED